MKNIISLLFILISLTIFGFRISKKIGLKQNVTGYLQRAADATTIELANEELTKTLNYLESNNITTGYTSVLWETPDEDIDFWYRNLKASQSELQNLKSESALEKTNVLMKLRETLLNSGERARVTMPDGLEVYPNNKLWAFLTLVATILGFIGFMIPTLEADRKAKMKANSNKV